MSTHKILKLHGLHSCALATNGKNSAKSLQVAWKRQFKMQKAPTHSVFLSHAVADSVQSRDGSNVSCGFGQEWKRDWIVHSQLTRQVTGDDQVVAKQLDGRTNIADKKNDRKQFKIFALENSWDKPAVTEANLTPGIRPRKVNLVPLE